MINQFIELRYAINNLLHCIFEVNFILSLVSYPTQQAKHSFWLPHVHPLGTSNVWEVQKAIPRRHWEIMDLQQV